MCKLSPNTRSHSQECSQFCTVVRSLHYFQVRSYRDHYQSPTCHLSNCQFLLLLRVRSPSFTNVLIDRSASRREIAIHEIAVHGKKKPVKLAESSASTLQSCIRVSRVPRVCLNLLHRI